MGPTYGGRVLLPVNITLGVVLALLLAAAAVVAGVASLGRSREIVLAGLRAAVQLAAVSVLIGWVVRSLPALLGFVALMYAVAVRTAGRRITANRTWWWAALPIAAGVAPVIAVLLLTGLLPVRGLALIPVTGILIGGALTATVLGGRRALDELTMRHGEVEAGMALGLLDRDARMEIARPKRRRRRCCRGWTRRGPWGSSRCPGRSWACCSAAPHRFRRGPCSCSCWSR